MKIRFVTDCPHGKIDEVREVEDHRGNRYLSQGYAEIFVERPTPYPDIQQPPPDDDDPDDADETAIRGRRVRKPMKRHEV